MAAGVAAALDEWLRVERLLGGALWIDSVGGGVGHTLLARAALERRADSLAVVQARRAILASSTDAARGERLVLLARAFDRLDLRDSARAAYAQAVDLLPTIGDWLRLRAAGVSRDSTTRWSFLTSVRGPAARERIGWTEAQARERGGDIEGAARQYGMLGARVTELRLRAALTGRDSQTRGAIRSELLELIRSATASGDKWLAVEVLDQLGRLTAAEELTIARGANGVVAASRIAVAYSRALSAGIGGDADRLQYGVVLSSLGRDREAIAVFTRLRGTSPVAAAASYQRGRSLLRRGNIAGARTALRRTLATFPRDTSTAWAMFVLSDLAADEGRDAAARATYRDLAHRFPGSSLASVARFRAAIIAFAAGNVRAAALEMDSLRLLYPRSEEVLAAGYWSGRAWARAGDSVEARERWRTVIAMSPLSYYSAASARRLGQAPWTPPVVPDTTIRLADVDSGMARAALLDGLGMGSEAELEYERLNWETEQNPTRLLVTARAYVAHGLAWRAARLATRALERSASSDVRMYRLAYPALAEALLTAESHRAGLDPAIVAAIIRQESGFNPRAASGAGARGLMQIMPAVGEQIARAQRVPEWSTSLLYQPEVSLTFGIGHLKAWLGQYDDLALALAAYNAGGSRVARWRRRAGSTDAELFTERISFPETRDYVRIVLRNRDLYRSLYAW